MSLSPVEQNVVREIVDVLERGKEALREHHTSSIRPLVLLTLDDFREELADSASMPDLRAV